ncbi:type III secretion system effector XopW [Xanthomonas vasicola]|uniref:type III secretion system effector XopW n=1 Tax=Xanthomonas vasicola TaxID=56459 RepID=UPI001F07DF1B|nr:type III secretion system effector XopW [Xanthomonas vasicola]MDO6932768.1 type III secretion system effector XopW [Xanthomonas vasicola]MDO6937277.1 type III secretion system effector XopW [Xanthomonas vasicola]MDO6957809.1 type III secretion system effector XopW [Xanthomonas vasicola]MDO6974791.1 type III secretion system effector XopW [Xanthomonas vasicola]
MKPILVPSALRKYSATSDTEVAGTSSRQPQSSGTSAQEQVNPMLQGLAPASHSRLNRSRANKGVRLDPWVRVEGEHDPGAGVLDTRSRRERYLEDHKPEEVSPEDVKLKDYKYRSSVENRELRIETNAREVAAALYGNRHTTPMTKEIKGLLKKGSRTYTKIRGNENDMKKEGALAVKQYETFERDARATKVNYDHKPLRASETVRRQRLRELEAAAAEKDQGGASSSGG